MQGTRIDEANANLREGEAKLAKAREEAEKQHSKLDSLSNKTNEVAGKNAELLENYGSATTNLDRVIRMLAMLWSSAIFF